MYRILVVDDEQLHLKGLVNMLRKLRPEYKVFEAKNGKEALELVMSNNIDIVVTDVKMPIMDGLEFIERLGEMAKKMKIIILSGYREFEYAQKAIKLGAFDYLLKPVYEEKIIEMLNRVEEKNGQTKSGVDRVIVNEDIKNNKHEVIIQRCMQYVEQHFMDDISLENIAQKMYFSNCYFSTVFKNHTGVTFSQYLSQIRIKKALELLQNPDYKVYEIASRVGYKDDKYFYKVFKKEFGVTPDEYRRNNIK